MRRNSILTLAFLFFVSSFAPETVSAQFPIKIPKIKTDKPKTEEPKTDNDASEQNQPTQSKTVGKTNTFVRPKPTSSPAFLWETLEINVKTDNRYWKFPNQEYSSWIPRVKFNLFYDNSQKVRYSADWSNPDGSPWYSESLDVQDFADDGTVLLRSPYSSQIFDTKSTAAVGTYGLKITNTKTGEVAFQGKFKVSKLLLIPNDVKMRNRMLFYVDNDWDLPIGYAGFDSDSWRESDLLPAVLMWFKGNLESKNFEARLFYNTAQIASTDESGFVNSGQKRGDDNCFEFRETCEYSLWKFDWNKFITQTENYQREKFPNATFTQDKPGEYTVKVFYNGSQVREAKFTVDTKGGIVQSGNSKSIYPSLTIIPVKVMGNLDKWNPASWKTDAFYGNPIAGFSVP